jgi:hypothetical protein
LLRVNRLRLEGLPTEDEFPLLGSLLSSKYRTSHWNKMYEAFTCPEGRRIRLEELPEPALESEESMLPIMIDHRGRVQHTIGSVDRAEGSKDWSKGDNAGDEGAQHPNIGGGLEGSLGKRRHGEERGNRGGDEDGNIASHESEVEDGVRRKKKARVVKSSFTIPEETDNSPSHPVPQPEASPSSLQGSAPTSVPRRLATQIPFADGFGLSPPIQTLSESPMPPTPLPALNMIAESSTFTMPFNTLGPPMQSNNDLGAFGHGLWPMDLFQQQGVGGLAPLDSFLDTEGSNTMDVVGTYHGGTEGYTGVMQNTHSSMGNQHNNGYFQGSQRL